MGTDGLIGQIVGGRYEIVRLIGKGGMGAIYEVRNTRVGRSFAMKTLIGQAAEDADVLARFRREADVVARIKHPNIVEVVDWEALPDGAPCIILEYLNGEDLAGRIREAAPMPWLFIARVADQILSALSVAHAAGIVHRDLKPQNIFLALDDSGEERAKLLDFGVSKIRDSRSFVTTDAKLLGTPAYMAPEQAEGRGDDVGPQTDLWAMGAILYELATGKLAFDAESLPAVLYRICSKDAEPIRTLRGDAPVAFVELVRDALQRDLAKRITSAEDLRARMREALADVAPQMRYSDKVMAVRSTPRRKRFTGAHDNTLAGTSDIASAQTVQSGAFSLAGATPTGAGQLSPTTVRRRKFRPLAAGVGAAALATLVATAFVATSSERDGEQLPQPSRKAIDVPAPDAAVIAQPASVDAGVDVPIDAPVAPVARKPPRKPPVVKVKPEDPPPPLVQPAATKPGKCDALKGTPDYKQCVLDGGGDD